MEPRIYKAQLKDLEKIIQIASCYPEDFASYIPKFPLMINSGRVYIIKQNRKILAFTTFGINKKDPTECFTSSARSPLVKREELSGDLIKSLFEAVLLESGFQKLSAHVRINNTNAIKMMIRNGYKQVDITPLLNKNEWAQFCKTISKF